tara:strand:- start:172 stop:348 length:177 start_codon:yes stop_codon:yes gene_type:complete
MKTIISFFADNITKARSLKQQVADTKKEMQTLSNEITEQVNKKNMSKVKENISEILGK